VWICRLLSLLLLFVVLVIIIVIIIIIIIKIICYRPGRQAVGFVDLQECFYPSVDKNVLYNYNINMIVFGEQAVGRVDLLAGSE
jgi:hypothetical protein